MMWLSLNELKEIMIYERTWLSVLITVDSTSENESIKNANGRITEYPFLIEISISLRSKYHANKKNR